MSRWPCALAGSVSRYVNQYLVFNCLCFFFYSLHLGIQSGPCEEELIRLDEAYVQNKYKVSIIENNRVFLAFFCHFGYFLAYLTILGSFQKRLPVFWSIFEKIWYFCHFGYFGFFCHFGFFGGFFGPLLVPAKRNLFTQTRLTCKTSTK